jgi:sodium-dependent dicarboxylate transporter 2/3/5
MRSSAIATILTPVAAMLAEDLRINPLLLVITVTLSCGYAFVLPIGTSANSLVYYHADLKISDMVNLIVFQPFYAQNQVLRKALKV